MPENFSGFSAGAIVGGAFVRLDVAILFAPIDVVASII